MIPDFYYDLILYFEALIPKDIPFVHNYVRDCIIKSELVLVDEVKEIAVFCRSSDDFYALIDFINFILLTFYIPDEVDDYIELVKLYEKRAKKLIEEEIEARKETERESSRLAYETSKLDEEEEEEINENLKEWSDKKRKRNDDIDYEQLEKKAKRVFLL
jgi:hypothetical protein